MRLTKVRNNRTFRCMKCSDKTSTILRFVVKQRIGHFCVPCWGEVSETLIDTGTRVEYILGRNFTRSAD